MSSVEAGDIPAAHPRSLRSRSGTPFQRSAAGGVEGASESSESSRRCCAEAFADARGRTLGALDWIMSASIAAARDLTGAAY